MLNGGLFLLILLMTWILRISKLDFSNALSELKAFDPRSSGARLAVRHGYALV